MKRVVPQLLVSIAAASAASAQELRHARAALEMGDTAFAISLLRELTTSQSSPETQCLFATVLVHTTTSRKEHWRVRLEAKQWFEHSVTRRSDPACLLEYASLMEKQGIRVDAARLANQALAAVRAQPEWGTPDVLAELYYRRAAPLASWIRNFEDLVLVGDLPVSTPNCDEEVLFCEAVLHPLDFRVRLERAPSGEDLVSRQRAVLRALLDSALALRPDHSRAFRLALRVAATERDWEGYLALGSRGAEAHPEGSGSLLALLSGLVFTDRYDSAAVVFDTLMARLGPDALARYEGLALIADTSLRERLQGREQVSYGEALWGLSDPLYLTQRNERRMAHYARIVLADVLFADPASGVAGRDTPQGRLVIRYGLPAKTFTVRADRRLQLTEMQRDLMERTLGCATAPTYQGARTTEKEGECLPLLAGGQSFDAGGRWEFWYYDDAGPPLIFERALGAPVARHMFDTRSKELDSLLHRRTPSTFVPPYVSGQASLLVTRFPRPSGVVAETWARFQPPPTASLDGRSQIGFFVHDAVEGRLLTHDVDARPASHGPLQEGRALEIPWTPVQITAEATWPGGPLAAQARARTGGTRHFPDSLAVSELLLGDSATGPSALTARDDVRFFGRADSIYQAGGAAALYWETYGLRHDPETAGSPSHVRYRVQLSLQDAERRPLGARILRSVGRVLGLEQEIGQALEWDNERLAAEVVPDLVILALPDYRGDILLQLTVRDLASGRVTTTRRIISLIAPTSN